MTINSISNINMDKAEYRKFGLLLALVLFGVGILSYFWKDSSSAEFLIPAAVVTVIAAFYFPVIYKIPYSIWMIAAAVLGWIMTRVILVILYYFILTPISIISRIFGKKFLDLKWKDPVGSYYRPRKNNTNTDSYDHQY